MGRRVRAVVVLTTAGSQREAVRLARMLVDARLAACVNVVPGVVSVFRWRGRLERARECVLVIKTTRRQVVGLTARLQRAHMYELPEVLVLPVVGGSREYLSWVSECVDSRN